MMSLPGVITLIKDILTILAIFVGAIAALFIFFQLAPVLTLRIFPAWTDKSQQFLLVRYEVANNSRVRIKRLGGGVQIFEHGLHQGGYLPNFIPFQEEDYKKESYGKFMGDEKPTWHEPSPIFETTKHIYPGETIVFERLYSCPRPAIAVHLGLQVSMKLGLWDRIITRKWEPWSQTTSCIIVKEHMIE
jgi:hypothetical protein